MPEQPRPAKKDKRGRAGKRRIPRKVSPQSLENTAAHYLGRYAASSARLSEVLMRKVYRSHHHHGTEVDEGAKMVDQVVEKFEGLGYLDDRAFADMRARSLYLRGTPRKGIRFKLIRDGVAEDVIEAALANLGEETDAADLDLAAALRLARRRRLGPFSSDDEEVRQEKREKYLAALARAGFSYDIALQVVDAPSVEELELAAYPDGEGFI